MFKGNTLTENYPYLTRAAKLQDTFIVALTQSDSKSDFHNYYFVLTIIVLNTKNMSSISLKNAKQD